MEDKVEIFRDQLGRLIPGQKSINPEGRPKDTEETKALRKASKEIIAEYKEALTSALPLIQPALILKAIEGDIQAIKEIHDRTMDKAKQSTDITSKGERILTNTIVFQDFKDETDSQSSV